MLMTSMTELDVVASQSTPGIRTDAAAGVLYMDGDSFPENAYELFAPVIGWVERYLSDGSAPLRLDLRLVYLNTSSVRGMLDVLDLLEAAHEQGRQVSLRWFYHPDNERVAELAEEFAEDYTFPFAILADEADRDI